MSFSKYRPKARKGNRTQEMRHAGTVLSGLLSRMDGGESRLRLSHLWRNWEMVMGSELAELALPLGHRSEILLVGAEDNFAMQELSFCVPEILERVNAFMDEPIFRRVELHLLLGRTPLGAEPDITPPTRIKPPLQCPQGLSGAANVDETSPVGRCYAAYLKAFGVEKKRKTRP